MKAWGTGHPTRSTPVNYLTLNTCRLFHDRTLSKLIICLDNGETLTLQVWAADITYIRMRHGFIYLVAVMDWFRPICDRLGDIHHSGSGILCTGPGKALRTSQAEIFNIDQGAQFSSTDFLDMLDERSIRISMDGRGRVYDNIFIERLWRTVKYEEVYYLHDYRNVSEARFRIDSYFQFYNTERPHEGLGYRTPYEVYSGQLFNPQHVQALSTLHLKQAHYLS